MKKLTALAVLLGGCVLLSACGSGAVIPGNYKTPTDAELEEALSSIDGDAMFGDPAAEDYRIGLRADASFFFSIRSGEQEMSADLDMDYLLSGTGETDVAGAGSLSAHSTENGTVTAADYTFYNDSVYFYFDDTTDDASGKKVTLDEIGNFISSALGSLGDLGNMPYAGTALLAESSTDPLPAESTLAQMQEAGIDVGLDTGSGVKLRLKMNETFFANLAAQIGQTNGMEVEFPAQTLEVYFYVNEDGLFEQVSAVVNVSMEMSYMDNTVTMELNGDFLLARSEEEVVLPEEVESYPETDLQLPSGGGTIL